MPKSIDGLMRYLRNTKQMNIKGGSQKRNLRNIGYYHGYKGYRFIGRSSNIIPYSDFKELMAIYDFDMRLKSILYPQLMFVETAIKNYVLEEVIQQSNSDSFNYIFTSLLTDYKRYAAGTANHKKALKKRLDLRNHVYSALTRDYNNAKDVVQHFYHNDENVPIWAIFEVMSLGEFGTFVSCLNYNTRAEVSRSIGFHQPADTDAFLLKKIIFAIKELRNAVAHNDVIFDTRFARANIDQSVTNALEIETGIQNVRFKSITDYVVFMLKHFQVQKTEMKRIVLDFEGTIETLRNNTPASIYTKIVHTDTRTKINKLKQYISAN